MSGKIWEKGNRGEEMDRRMDGRRARQRGRRREPSRYSNAVGWAIVEPRVGDDTVRPRLVCFLNEFAFVRNPPARGKTPACDSHVDPPRITCALALLVAEFAAAKVGPRFPSSRRSLAEVRDDEEAAIMSWSL